MDFVISRANVLPFDGATHALCDCDIVVSAGRIAALGPGLAGGSPGRVIDGRDLLVMPGFVNAHTHSPENLAKGHDEGSTLDTWRAKVWPRLDALPPRHIYVAALLGAVEMLRTGTVAIVDHFRQTPMKGEAIDAVCKAYEDAGMRALVAVMLRDRPGPTTPRVAPAHEQLEIARSAGRTWASASARVRVGLGPSAPTRCTDSLLVEAEDLARRDGFLIHMHIDETRQEGVAAREIYGRSSTQHLAELGLLTPRLSLAHGTWLDEADIDRLSGSGVSVVHNPVSNMRLGSGIAPVAGLRRRSVPVVLGTDGAASNDGQNVAETVKVAMLLQRIAGGDPAEWISAREALAMATRVPARIFGFGPGYLATGAPADFVAFRKTTYALAPANDWYRQIAFCSAGLDARFVAVDGRLLLDDGRVAAFDESAVLAEAQDIAGLLFGDETRGG